MKPGQHRETARVLLKRPSGEILLFLTEFDPEVQLPPRWLIPGGGIDEGESVIEAAVRELFEETGIQISQDQLTQHPKWIFSGRWDWGDGLNHHTYVDHIFELEIKDFSLDSSGWTKDEFRDILQHRWWKVSELISAREPVSPPGLLEALSEHGL